MTGDNTTLVYYDSPNTLRFLLAHTLRSEYKRDPADFKGLFSTDALRYWLTTGKHVDQILLETVGQPDKTRKSLWEPAEQRSA